MLDKYDKCDRMVILGVDTLSTQRPGIFFVPSSVSLQTTWHYRNLVNQRKFLIGVCGMLTYTLDCKSRGQGFDSGMGQGEGSFPSSSRSTLVQTHQCLRCTKIVVHNNVYVSIRESLTVNGM